MNKIVLSVIAVGILAGCGGLSAKTSTEQLARGEMYYKTGEFKKSLKAFNKAVEKDPYNIEAYASRGTLLFELGEYDAAMNDFDIVINAMPERSEAYSAYGAALAAKGEYDKAEPYLLQALSHNPGNVEAISSLGGVFYSRGEYKKAVDAYTSALTFRKAPQIYFTRGLAYDKLGKLKEAKEDFEAAGYEVGPLPEPPAKADTKEAAKPAAATAKNNNAATAKPAAAKAATPAAKDAKPAAAAKPAVKK